MSRVLDEQAVVETMSKWLGYRTDAEQYPLRELLSRLPSVRTERKKGHWIHKGCGCFECDQCGKLVGSNVYTDAKVSNCFKFCPNCGADMREEK